MTTLAATAVNASNVAQTVGDSDESLLKRFGAGDETALALLASRLERPMLGLAFGLLNGRRDAAMDAVQETWVRVIRYARSFRGDAGARTWIYRILVNRCHTLRAKAAKVGRVSDAPIGERGHTDATERHTAETEDVIALRTAVARIAEPKRTIILLCYHAGLTHAQVANILGIPLGTLKSRLHAALDELRRTLATASS